jgi:hypothetical protein
MKLKKIFSSLREIIKFTKKWKDYKRTKKFMKKYMKNENWCYATILNGFKLWHVDSDLYQVRGVCTLKENFREKLLGHLLHFTFPCTHSTLATIGYTPTYSREK